MKYSVSFGFAASTARLVRPAISTPQSTHRRHIGSNRKQSREKCGKPEKLKMRRKVPIPGTWCILSNLRNAPEISDHYVDIVGVAGSIPAAPTILASESRRFLSVGDHGLGVSYCLNKPSTVPKTWSGGAMLGR